MASMRMLRDCAPSPWAANRGSRISHLRGIQQYASRPPRSLTAALGREIEKYDQLCDAIDTQLACISLLTCTVPLAETKQQHAVTILQRDIRREEERLKVEAEAAAAAAAAATQAAIAFTSSPTMSPTSPSMSNPFTGLPIESSPDSADSKSLHTPRRQSTVSLSSLQRPNFQHKLDLSSASMRINPEELFSIPSVLSSPVTLAPKSSHRVLPQELVMAALSEANRPVDIDLTVTSADMQIQHVAGAAASLDPTAGTSADKPIELDLDMDMDIFNAAANGASGASNQQMFSQPSAMSIIGPDLKPKQEEDFFKNALNAGTASGNMGDILTSLGGGAPIESDQPPNLALSSPMKAPSSGTMLANFDAVQQHPASIPRQPHDAHFDINSMDLGGFGAEMFGGNLQDAGMSMSEVENMFNIDGSRGQKDATAS